MNAGRLLVTGASGRVGSFAARRLADDGYEVVGVDRRAPAGEVAARLAGIPVRVFDLLDADRLAAAVRGCAGVVHLAAHPSPRGLPPEVVFRDNVGATASVLETAARAGVEGAVIASSTSALGMAYAPSPLSPRYVPIDEEHPAEPLDPYALSKLTDEQTARSVHRRTGLRVLALRFHWVALPGAAAAEAGAQPEKRAHDCWGYVDVRDAARAVRLALAAEGVPFGVMNVVAADSLAAEPTRALIERLHPTTEIRAELPGTTSAWAGDRARELIGFVPAFSWRDAA
jgi:nucleoside-diphosphate-sugar epimerase